MNASLEAEVADLLRWHPRWHKDEALYVAKMKAELGARLKAEGLTKPAAKPKEAPPPPWLPVPEINYIFLFVHDMKAAQALFASYRSALRQRPEDYMSLETLRAALRALKGMTHRELAERSGVHQQTFTDILGRRQNRIGAPKFCRIVNALIEAGSALVTDRQQEHDAGS